MHDSWNDQRGNLEPGHTLLPGRRFLGKEKLHTSEQYSQSSPTPPTMPITSNYPDLPLQESDIFSFLFSRKDRPFPDDKVIFQDGEDLSRQSTFAQVKQSAVDFGKGLKNIFKVRKGDVLAIFAPNDIDFAPVVFGALWAGCVVSPANPGYTVGELAFQLKDSAAKAVACHLSVLETVKKACNEVDIPHSNIFTIGTKSDPTQRIRHWTSMRDSEEGGTRDRSLKFAPKNDPAFLVYSSGTTGKPKGVTLTHFNMTSNIQQIQLTENWLTWDGSKMAQRTGGDLDARGVPVLRVPGRLRTPRAQRLEVVQLEPVTGQEQLDVQRQAGVTAGQDEAVAADPVLVARVVAHHPLEQRVGQRSEAHGGAGMPVADLLDRVRGQHPDGVHRAGIQLGPVLGDRAAGELGNGLVRCGV